TSGAYSTCGTPGTTTSGGGAEITMDGGAGIPMWMSTPANADVATSPAAIVTTIDIFRMYVLLPPIDRAGLWAGLKPRPAPKEYLAIAFRAGQDRLCLTCNGKPQLVEHAADTRDRHRALGRVAYHAPFAHGTFPHLELRLHERHDVAALREDA